MPAVLVDTLLLTLVISVFAVFMLAVFVEIVAELLAVEVFRVEIADKLLAVLHLFEELEYWSGRHPVTNPT